MATSYEVRVFDPTGATILTTIATFESLEYVLVENDVSTLTITIPQILPFEFFKEDTQLQVWRQIDNGMPYLEGNTAWLVRKAALTLDEAGSILITVTAYDLNHLLTRRIINYASTTSQASKTDQLDDMMRVIVREQLGSLAVPVDLTQYGASIDRAIGPDYLTVEVDTSQLTSISKAFAWRNMMAVLQDLAGNFVNTAPTIYVAFKIIKTSGVQFEFRVFKNQLGVDNRSSVILSPEFGNLASVTIENDWTNKATLVKVGGQGEGTDRKTASAYDDRNAYSPFSLIEVFRDARNVTTTAGLQQEAQAELWTRRGRRRVRGQLVETPTLRYGVHYRHGDIVTVQFGNFVYPARITKVRVRVDSASGETVNAEISNDGFS